MRTIKKRRRLEGKTDYKARLVMLKSRKDRVIFRKTNKYILGQFVKSENAQDKVSVSVSSKELVDYGWPSAAMGSLKSLTAAYLTGLLLGKKVADKEENAIAIFDTGLIRNIPKSRVYAFLKGAIDSGIKIPCKKEVFPDEKRIEGRHLKKEIHFEKIREKIKNG